MSNAYSVLSALYDELSENVDYQVRSDYISDFLITKGVLSGKLLDLGCGTGSFSLEMIEKGYDVTGVDISDEMLSIAANKLDGKAELIKASMVDYLDEGKYDAVICMLDCINHLDGIGAVQQTFHKCYKNLRDGGVLIFDVNTIYKHKCVLADNTFVFEGDDYMLVWDNEYLGDNEVKIILDLFTENEDGTYNRMSESWNEIAYKNTDIKTMLKAAGFTEILSENSPFDGDTKKPERVYYICRK